MLNLQFLLIYCLVFYEKLFLNIFLLAKKYFQGLVSLKGIIEQTLQEFDFFELIGVCFKYILIFLVGIC